MSTGTATPFRIDVPEARLQRIRAALDPLDWPPTPADDDGRWGYGTDAAYLRQFIDHWRDAYDWRAAEARLNRWPQFMASVEGTRIHFYHVRGSGRRPLPVVLTHGWPGSVFEFVHLIEPLCFPERFGGDPDDGFDLVIPSLPGMGLSPPPSGPIGPRAIAGLWRRLMTEVLGYDRFAAQGGDLGSAVSGWLGCDHADVTTAVHLNLCVPPMIDGPEVDDEELCWRQAYREVQQRDSAYMVEHATRPQTVAAVLSASPVALAAWMIEKFQAWGDTGGDVETRFSKDQLITNLMLHLAGGTAGSGVWLYRGAAVERATGRFDGFRVEVPTAVAIFPAEFLPPPPRRVVERYYRLERWTQMAAGGHFAALEEPDAFVADLQAFLRPIRRLTDAG